MKIINALANNNSRDIKLSKAQLSKMIQLSRFFGQTLSNAIGNLDKKSIVRPCCSFSYIFLPK